MGNIATVSEPRKLRPNEIERLDPYVFMAVIGKRVIHPGGRVATEQLLKRAAISPSDRVLDVGCGVATTRSPWRAGSARASPRSTSPR